MKTLNSNLMYSGRIFKVSENTVVMPDGSTALREKIDTPHGVGIIAVTADDEVLFVKQERYVIDQYTIEIPAGKMEYGEDPENAALREFREETGYEVHSLSPLAPSVPMGAMCTEVVHIFEADTKDMRFVGTDFDEDEFVELVKIPFSKAVQMVCSGEICDAKTVSAVLQLYVKRTGGIN